MDYCFDMWPRLSVVSVHSSHVRPPARLASILGSIAAGDSVHACLDDGRHVTGTAVGVRTDQSGRTVVVVSDRHDVCWQLHAARSQTGWCAVYARQMTQYTLRWERYGRVVDVT